MGVKGGHEQAVPENGKATIDHAATRLKFLRQISLIPPDSPSRAGVEGEGAVILPGPVEHAIHDEGGGLKLAKIGYLKSPLHRET